MPLYRLYHLDIYTGHIHRAEDMFAADDVAAVHDCQQRKAGNPMELWQGGRKVTRIDAAPETAARLTVW